MDRIYEGTLLAALGSGVTAVVLALAGRIQAAHAIGSSRWSFRAAMAGWAALLVSFTTHLWWGHTPGSPQALSALAFVQEHRGFVAAALIPGLALIARARPPTSAG